MNQSFTTILTIINAPYRRHIDEFQLARCLRDDDYAEEFSGQVWSFFGDVPVEDQIAFAAHYSIHLEELLAIAEKFARYFGTDFPINSRKL